MRHPPHALIRRREPPRCLPHVRPACPDALMPPLPSSNTDRAPLSVIEASDSRWLVAAEGGGHRIPESTGGRAGGPRGETGIAVWADCRGGKCGKYGGTRGAWGMLTEGRGAKFGRCPRCGGAKRTCAYGGCCPVGMSGIDTGLAPDCHDAPCTDDRNDGNIGIVIGGGIGTTIGFSVAPLPSTPAPACALACISIPILALALTSLACACSIGPTPRSHNMRSISAKGDMGNDMSGSKGFGKPGA